MHFVEFFLLARSKVQLDPHLDPRCPGRQQRGAAAAFVAVAVVAAAAAASAAVVFLLVAPPSPYQRRRSRDRLLVRVPRAGLGRSKQRAQGQTGRRRGRRRRKSCLRFGFLRGLCRRGRWSRRQGRQYFCRLGLRLRLHCLDSPPPPPPDHVQLPDIGALEPSDRDPQRDGQSRHDDGGEVIELVVVVAAAALVVAAAAADEERQ